MIQLKKAIICGLLAVVFCPTGVSGQFHYGFKIGPSRSTLKLVEVGDISASGVDPQTGQFGYLFEVMVGTELGPAWQLRSGLNTAIRGEREFPLIFGRDNDLRLQYIGLPVYLSYCPIGILELRGGMEYAFLLTTRQAQDLFFLAYQPQEFSLLGGLAFTIGPYFEVEARYVYGISDFLLQDFMFTGEGRIAKTAYRSRMLQVSLGVYF